MAIYNITPMRRSAQTVTVTIPIEFIDKAFDETEAVPLPEENYHFANLLIIYLSLSLLAQEDRERLLDQLAAVAEAKQILDSSA